MIASIYFSRRRTSWMRAAAAFFGAAVLALSLPAYAQQTSGSSGSAKDDALREQIKQEVLRDLIEGGQLEAAIDAGIKRYVGEQRKAQAKARARQQAGAAAAAKNVRRVSADRDHIYGNPDASVSLIEYSDFECPFCKRFHPTAKKIVETYDGQVNWVYRHFPLAFHNPGAQKQAEASECAAALGGNDAFWQYTDLIYKRTRSNGKGFPIKNLVPLAKEIGLEETGFRECLDEGRFAERVTEDLEEGARIGITGTPGNILLHNTSGEVIPRPGAAPYDTLKQLIDQLLESAG
jgi:protein-disulfide isomerase